MESSLSLLSPSLVPPCVFCPCPCQLPIVTHLAVSRLMFPNANNQFTSSLLVSLSVRLIAPLSSIVKPLLCWALIRCTSPSQPHRSLSTSVLLIPCRQVSSPRTSASTRLCLTDLSLRLIFYFTYNLFHNEVFPPREKTVQCTGLVH